MREDQASKPMSSYIGTPASRVDGRAKVTGAAKYAGEFNTNGLAYGSVVTSSIARGRITRIDASQAKRVDARDTAPGEHRQRLQGRRRRSGWNTTKRRISPTFTASVMRPWRRPSQARTYSARHGRAAPLTRHSL